MVLVHNFDGVHVAGPVLASPNCMSACQEPEVQRSGLFQRVSWQAESLEGPEGHETLRFHRLAVSVLFVQKHGWLCV